MLTLLCSVHLKPRERETYSKTLKKKILKLGDPSLPFQNSRTEHRRTQNTCPLAHVVRGGGRTQWGTHHGNGRVELPDAHPARRVLAVEALVRDEAAVGELHRWLCRVRVQVDELFTWVRRQGAGWGPTQTCHTEIHLAGHARLGWEPDCWGEEGPQEAGTSRVGTLTPHGSMLLFNWTPWVKPTP